MNDRENPVAGIAESYARSIFDKDVDAFMRLYDPHVRVFDTWGNWSYEGRGAWRKMVEGWFASLGTDRVKVDVDDLQIVEGERLAAASAVVTYTGVSAEDVPLRAMQNRLTWTLKLEGGAWKIVHEHTSVPVGFDDGKAILRRPTSTAQS